MRIAAALLLLIAFVLNILEGAGYLMLGLMGEDMVTPMSAMVGQYSASLEGELIHVSELMTLVGSFLGALVGASDHALAATGVLLMVVGLLALTAGIRLLRQRPGMINYIGCLATIIADAPPLVLQGISFLQLPGLIGGLLGILATGSLPVRVMSKPAVIPVAIAKPGATAKPREARTIRPTVRSASDPRPDPDPVTAASSRVMVFISVGVIFIGCVLVAYLAYHKYFGQDAAEAPTQATAPAPVPAPAQAPSKKPTGTSLPPAPEAEAKIPSGPVKGQLAGVPFKPDRAVLKVTTSWTGGGGKTSVFGGKAKSKSFERLSLVLEAGKDLQIEITDLPMDYNFATGLKLQVSAGAMKPGQPKLTLTSPQSGGFPKTEFVSNLYDLDLKLDPLKGNRVNGRISFSLPAYKKTHVAGNFKAWVDGHPEIEPDLLRGGRQTFKYLAFQYLKDIHPGSEIVIKDDTYSHQVGDASRLLRGHIMVVYTVNGEESASILRVSTSEGYWRVLDSMEATYLPEAHPIEIPDTKNEGQWLNYLAATHTEEWFREKHPGKYPWSVVFTGSSNTEIGYADIHMRLEPYGESEVIERRYYFRRKDGRWRYIRDLNEGEEIDQSTGEIVKKS
ncbi:MAG: hypothetical protein OER43_15255 [Gammaproteobacteria bacterium]|nr:hypothetical protein [Gammaproteobacteria bacterium]